jgi:hypothetical protein
LGRCVECETNITKSDMNDEVNKFYVTLLSTAFQTLFSSDTQRLYSRISTNHTFGFERQVGRGICELACPPPKAGIYAAFTVVGASRAVIYCNLTSPQFVGCELVRCLRTFIFPSQYCHYTYDNIYYLPVEKRMYVTFDRSFSSYAPPFPLQR